MTRINEAVLTDWIRQILIGSGLDQEQAQMISEHLVLANLRGVDSHGISKIDVYCKRLEKGVVNKKLNFRIAKETPVSALIDGENSMGISLATKGIELAVRKAKEVGVGIIGISHSNHAGMLAAYTDYAAQHDCISIAVTNAPSVMAPWGGRTPFFGTNPISYSIPTGGEMNIVFDMATTTVAKGKIVLAEKENKSIPVGWAISKDGRETTDPKEALEGLLLPVGGPKGYGLSFLVETLSSLFTGAAYGPYIGSLFDDFEHEQNVGQFFFVMRADLFQELDVFKARVDQMAEEIKGIERMQGVERIYLPGEIEFERARELRKNGIPVSAQMLATLQAISDQLEIKTEQFSPVG